MRPTARREFTGEVGIIVVGALIALATEAPVEDWSWRQKADDARRAIHSELAQDAGVFDERTMNAPCQQKHLLQAVSIAERKSSRKNGVCRSV